MNKPTKAQLSNRVVYLEEALSALAKRLGPSAGLTEVDIQDEVQALLNKAPSLAPETLPVLSDEATN